MPPLVDELGQRVVGHEAGRGDGRQDGAVGVPEVGEDVPVGLLQQRYVLQAEQAVVDAEDGVLDDDGAAEAQLRQGRVAPEEGVHEVQGQVRRDLPWTGWCFDLVVQRKPLVMRLVAGIAALFPSGVGGIGADFGEIGVWVFRKKGSKKGIVNFE